MSVNVQLTLHILCKQFVCTVQFVSNLLITQKTILNKGFIKRRCVWSGLFILTVVLQGVQLSLGDVA